MEPMENKDYTEYFRELCQEAVADPNFEGNDFVNGMILYGDFAWNLIQV